MRGAFVILSAGAAFCSTPAFAQDGGRSPPADRSTAATAVADQADVAGDVVVTATRRSVRLADVPVAVTAVTAAALQNSGATDIRQLDQLAPSLLVSSTTNEASASARIRGIGTVGDNPGLESSVATFIDGVYRSRTGVGLTELGAIDRIEVLRGPQGTLFGRNASAGLLNIVTQAPEFSFHANGEASYGNYNYHRLSGGITGPVTDTLALRLDGTYVKRDGFFRDVISGSRPNNRDRYLVRAQALFEPTDSLSIRLIGDYAERHEACCAAVFATTDAIGRGNGTLITPANPTVPLLLQVAGTDFAGYFPSAADPYDRRIAITPGQSYAGTTKDYGGSAEVDWRLGGASLTSITAYREYSAFQASDDDYGPADIINYGPGQGRTFHTFSQELRLQGKAFGDRLDWLVGGYFSDEDLFSRGQIIFGADYGAFTACRLLATISPAIPRNAQAPGCRAGPNGAVTDAALTGLFGPGANGARVFVNGLNLLSTISNVGDIASDFRQNSRNIAAFTHDIVHLTRTVDLTLGLRYTHERKALTGAFANDNAVCPAAQAQLLPYLTGAAATTVPASLIGGILTFACQGNATPALDAVRLDDDMDENKLTGTAILSWKPGRDWLFYGSFARGYKAGGYNLDRSAFVNPAGAGPLPIFPVNPAYADAYAAALRFAPEVNDAFEIGAKYSSRHATSTAAAFRQAFRNFQLNTFNGTVFLVQNINGCGSDLGGLDRDTSAATGACDRGDVGAGVISRGVELEATVTPVRDFAVGAGITYADTRYADDLVGSDEGTPLDPALRFLPGRRLSNAPAVVVTNSVTWTPPIGGTGLSALFYADSRTTSDYNTGSDLFPQKEQDGFTVVNARVGLRGRGGRWGVELWAQNLFDADYTQVSFTAPYQAAGANAAYPAARYPAGTQIFGAFLGEPRTYGLTLRSRF